MTSSNKRPVTLTAFLLKGPEPSLYALIGRERERERERERALLELLGIIHNGGSRSETRTGAGAFGGGTTVTRGQMQAHPAARERMLANGRVHQDKALKALAID